MAPSCQYRAYTNRRLLYFTLLCSSCCLCLKCAVSAYAELQQLRDEGMPLEQ